MARQCIATLSPVQAGVHPGRFTRTHAKIAAWVFAAVAGFILLVTRTPLYALEVALGPFAGAAARKWETHYVKAGLHFLPYALGCLLAGAVVQLAVPTRTKPTRAVRYIVWALAVTGWYFFALLTYGEALE